MIVRRVFAIALVLGLVAWIATTVTAPAAAPTGQATYAVHYTLAPRLKP